MRLSRLLPVLRRRWWIGVACPVVAGIAALVVSSVLPPVYEAHVSLLVRPSQPLASSDPNVAALTSDQISATYARLMTERPLLEKVIGDVGLRTTPDKLAAEIKVQPEPGTTILDVLVQDTDARRAEQIANVLVTDFITDVKRIQQQESSNPNSRSADDLVIVAPAVQPDRPVSPNVGKNAALAVVGGLVLAGTAIFLLEHLDQSVKGDDDLIQGAGLIPIGHVGYVPSSSGRRGELVTLSREPVAEAYKALRTNLLFSSVDRPVKTIVVTSAMAEEGKSRTAANLAIALGEAGYRTLLVDADLRRPSQHRIFGKVRNIGLANLFVKEGSEAELIDKMEFVPNVWLLASGPQPPNPSELLGSGRMRALLGQLKEQFAYVVIDTPPLTAVTDASILAAFCDGTVLVVAQGATPLPAVVRSRHALERVGATILGVVVNKVRSRAAGYYEYGYGGYERRQPGAVAQATAASGGRAD